MGYESIYINTHVQTNVKIQNHPITFLFLCSFELAGLCGT